MVKINRKDFKDKILICKSYYKSDDYALVTQREGMIWKYAAILPRQTGFIMTLGGYNALGNINKITHDIYISRDTNIVITTNTWLYRHRKKSPSQWYKVQNIIEIDNLLKLSCAFQDESNDNQVYTNTPKIKNYIKNDITPPIYKDL